MERLSKILILACVIFIAIGVYWMMTNSPS